MQIIEPEGGLIFWILPGTECEFIPKDGNILPQHGLRGLPGPQIHPYLGPNMELHGLTALYSYLGPDLELHSPMGCPVTTTLFKERRLSGGRLPTMQHPYTPDQADEFS